jgi:phosphoribosyl 1,2-cyclic phosphodiesterase
VKSVRFWGTRGSLPIALTAKDLRARIVAALRASAGRPLDTDAEVEAFVASLPFAIAGTYGGHSPCVEIVTGGPDHVLCDLGSGVRPFGESILARHGAAPQTLHVFLSHLHWDHIMGLPFFGPAYVPGNRLCVYGGHEGIEAALRRQMEPPSFPVPFQTMRASFEFVRLAPDRVHEVAGLAVTVMPQRHGGGSFGYRFDDGARSVVYSTDSEHRLEDPAEREAFVRFFRDADLVVFDAMYSLADAVSVKQDWGHSSNVVAVELCQEAGVRHLCLFHHEPALDDASIARVLAESRRLEEITRTGSPLAVSAAYDGLDIPL